MEKNKYIIVVVLGIIVLVVYFLIEKLCNSCIYNFFREDFLKFIEDNIAKHKEIYLPICIVIILIIIICLIICLIIFFIDNYKKFNNINKENIDRLKLFVEHNLEDKENILFSNFNEKETIEKLNAFYNNLFKDKSYEDKLRIFNRLNAVGSYVKEYDYISIMNSFESIFIVILTGIISMLSDFLNIYIIILYAIILVYMMFLIKTKYNIVKDYGISFITFKLNALYLINYLRDRISLEIEKTNNVYDPRTITNQCIISLNENFNDEKIEEIKSLAKYENNTVKIFIWNNCK